MDYYLILNKPEGVIKEALSKTYGDQWLSAQSGIKARLRRQVAACQEVATPSPDCAESLGGRVLKHASATLQPSPRTMAKVGPAREASALGLAFGLRLASTCFRARRDPIGLAQWFPNL
ncbi:MAG: hypothetical protein ACERLB_06495 [Gammaproteobacteria bacterium]